MATTRDLDANTAAKALDATAVAFAAAESTRAAAEAGSRVGMRRGLDRASDLVLLRNNADVARLDLRRAAVAYAAALLATADTGAR